MSYWPLNGDAKDVVGHYDGLLEGSAKFEQADDFPLGSRKVLALDGTEGYVEVPHSDSIDFKANQDFTVEVWAKSDAFTIGGAILSKGAWFAHGGPGYFIAYPESPEKMYVGVSDRKEHSIQLGLEETFDWTHIALVKKGRTLTAYVNGVESVTTPKAVNGSVSNAKPLYIGNKKDKWGNPGYFKGKIADVRLECGATRHIPGGNSSRESLLAVFAIPR